MHIISTKALVLTTCGLAATTKNAHRRTFHPLVRVDCGKYIIVQKRTVRTTIKSKPKEKNL